MSKLEPNLANRQEMLRRLRAEIVGPDPAGAPVTLVDKQAMSWDEFRAAKCQMNGEEIVWQDPPTKRFGAGILFPQGTNEMLAAATQETGGELPPDSKDLRPEGGSADGLEASSAKPPLSATGIDDGDEEEVTLANAFRPSALGLSFLADLGRERHGLCVELANIGRVDSDKTIDGPAGCYKPITLQVGAVNGKPGTARKVWLRQPVLDAERRYPTVNVTTDDLLQAEAPIRRWIVQALGLRVVIIARSWQGAPSPTHRLITISVVNARKAVRENLEESCIFQAGLRVSGLSKTPWIDSYPEYLTREFEDLDPLSDENVNRVLYRASRTFAIGHGCGADWVRGRPERVACVWSDVLPVFETPSTSADLMLKDDNGNPETGPDGRPVILKASMRKLAGLDANDDGFGDVERLVREYRKWIADLGTIIASIETRYHPTATALVDQCRACADRIESGIELLRGGNEASSRGLQAFRLANEAMLLAQLRSRQKLRTPSRDAAGRLSWDLPILQLDPSEPHQTVGYWRPFQIAFLLMSLRGIVDQTHEERELVDLIWFPTGGGKTEAYLGLTAFTVFFNAISRAKESGVDVLMRYTLRLLTAQQFQRAATLFCAMEHIRRRDTQLLGGRPFRIGLWVGGSATPNRRADAIEKLRALQRDPGAENPYVLLRCPWCASKFGPHPTKGGAQPKVRGSGSRRAGSAVPQSEVFGYVRDRGPFGDTVIFRCGDTACEFGGIPGPSASSLPVVVIDDDLLDSPPNLLIGTVDKFAMLAWDPRARSIFGLDQQGDHQGIPPTLVIQDELHLISGPLGSMVGAYETAIESLCIDPMGGMVKPKIVASTATISRAGEQVRGLYARRSMKLFPPSGLDAADSFFAREAVDENGKPRPGRLYAGVLAPAHGSLQTSEARIFATLMQHAALLEGEPSDLDPWWSLLVFFNSLRELGAALTLFSADTREYLRVILTRHGVDYGRIRQLFQVEELTSRIRGDYVPRLLERLEVQLNVREGQGKPDHEQSPVDACLASNIIEVGVDIQRLSLMAIVGQPKTTSQYIQVSSRVGRDLEKPGLVVVIYGQTKPRDCSHYERFRSYHQRLYAQVEPTSVTPFSPPAVDRSLHGLMVALVRQLGRIGHEAETPDPFPLDTESPLRARIEDTIRERVRMVEPDEEEAVMDKLRFRLDQWRAWSPATYGGFGQAPEDAPLMHPAGSAERPEWRGRSWPTMSSLRNVDASCEADITDAYLPLPGASE